MRTKGRLIQLFAPPFIRVAFALKLRKPWSKFCRWLQQENDRAPLVKYATPADLERAMASFQYRKDPLEGQLDYTSHPEYVQAMLNDPKRTDEDCDGGHWYVANCLKLIEGVDKVFFLSSQWDGPKGIGGHATAVYRYFGQWFHFDWKIYEIDDPNNAPQKVANRYGGEGSTVLCWVWESVGEVGNDASGWQPLAISPKTLQA